MENLKLDLNLSKSIYEKYCDYVKHGECYNNTFNIIYNLKNSRMYNIDEYKIGYGFIVKLIDGVRVFFRHGFIISKVDYSIVDVTACLWENVEYRYHNYEYYVFKEYTVKEYFEILKMEDGMSALYGVSEDEEIKLYNHLIQKGYECNSTDYINLFERIYKDDISKGDREYSLGNSILYNPNIKYL